MLTFSACLLQLIPQLGHLLHMCIMQALHLLLLLHARQGLLATSLEQATQSKRFGMV